MTELIISTVPVTSQATRESAKRSREMLGNGGFGMSDKFHLSLEQIDNGFVVRGTENTVYREKAVDAVTQLRVFVDVVLKELQRPKD